VFNHEFCPVVDHGWMPSSTWRSFDFLEHKAPAMERAGFLDEVPVMTSTVLGLDMLLNGLFVDLRMASELILGDVGATIHILRLIRREYGIAAERPSRMVDCIAGLDVSVWFAAISARTFVGDRKHAATTAVWKHSRLVAQYAQLVAESLEGVSPEDAYLVGLLHGIEAIPAALGWPHCGRGGRQHDVVLAMGDALPPFVLAAMQSNKDSSAPSVWNSILTAAHELAGVRTDFDASAFGGKTSVLIGSRD
jgi:hypothetical protein